ncbi:MAG: asparaginase [Rhodoferax sp.]
MDSTPIFKNIVFLGTGGTIAGTASSAQDNVGYQSAQLGVSRLLEAMPALPAALGGLVLESEQVLQIDSKDMECAHWLALAQRVRHHLARESVQGVVVTHGTDTLEETAFFLSQVLSAECLARKPVVLTCAMRPASSMAPDGPQNVLDALALVRAEQASGVLVVCAGVVHAARQVQKIHPYRLNAFDSGEAGPVAVVQEGALRWLRACPVEATPLAGLDLEHWRARAWPRVEVLMSYAGATGASVRALCAAPVGGDAPLRGIVVAGTGNGTIHASLQTALQAAQAAGVRVVRSTRCAYGAVVPAAQAALPDAHGLSPLKARIALRLELMADPEI